MQDLYNRIRPKSFSEMMVTSNFLKDIDNQVKATLEGKPGLPHVMIFHSAFIPGLGKTSCARILAVKLNPKISEQEADDIYKGLPSMICREVNATDMKKPDIAALIDNMMGAAQDIYGYNYIYIINEAHKLTEDSVVLLLSMEDLPSNVYVIMTTTDTTKIRSDLLSRSRTYSFKPVTDDMLIKHMKSIIMQYKNEYAYSSKYELEKESAKLHEIVGLASGSIRDAIKLLEQYMATGEIDHLNDATSEEKDRFRVFFSDFLRMWIDVMDPAGTSTWSDIVKAYNSITLARTGRSGMPAEEFRKGLLFRIQSRITSDNAINEGLSYNESIVYSYLEKYMIDMLIYPVSTQLILKLHMAYMDIIKFRDSDLNANKTVTPD